MYSETRAPKVIAENGAAGRSLEQTEDRVELTAEQRELLEPLIERDSQAFFEFMKQQITDVTDKLVMAFVERTTQLRPDDVEPLLVAGGLKPSDVHEAANMIAFVAKRASSPEDFQNLLAEQFDPARRLSSTMEHYKTNSPNSWYNTPEGTARLQQLLAQLKTEN